jgi:glyoxylase-like metal-dependent hydrolase (beta-lactamase superfamily II)
MPQAKAVPSGESADEHVSVLSVKYGERVVRKSDVFYDYSSYALPDGELNMDYDFWVIRSHGSVILVDTGYDIPAHDWLGEISVTPTPVGLELIELDPLDVDLVITSHFHYDHIGYLGLFENADVVSGQAEYDYWFAKKAANDLDGEFTTAKDLEPIEKADREGRLRLVSEPTEVFPGITVFPVGGHCPGELLTLVKTDTSYLLLTVDAAHFYEQVENEWPFFAFTDIDEMRNGLSTINRILQETGATVIPGHDARVRDRFPAADGPAGAVATVLA